MTCLRNGKKKTFGDSKKTIKRKHGVWMGSRIGRPSALGGSGPGQRCHGQAAAPSRATAYRGHLQHCITLTQGTMDYSSAIANDAGGSPWASSPQHDRSTFPQSNNHDVPASNTLSHQPPAPDGDDFRQDDQLPPQSNQYTSQQPQAQSYDNSNRSEPQRYHHARPQHPPQQPSHQGQPQQYQQQQQQQQPPQQPRKQYKLQAKITALERTGRKDPILRFDVYVGCFWGSAA